MNPIFDFFLKIKIDNETGCWEWQGYKNPQGYGNIRQGGKNWLTHRWAFTQAYGDIPDGMAVCHQCDNPPCCNPLHLWLGSLAENNRDMKVKRRSTSGERNAQAKLSTMQVLEIKELLNSGETQRSIAEKYGVSRSLVGQIKQGRRRAYA